MPETKGITSHSHTDSHNITQCLHSEETIQRKSSGGNLQKKLTDQNTGERKNPEETASLPWTYWKSFPHTAVVQAKNMLAKGIGFFKKLTADNRQTSGTELQQEALIGTQFCADKDRKTIAANTTEIRSELHPQRDREKLQRPVKYTGFTGQKRKQERQLLEGNRKNFALEDSYLLDSYNKNGEYTRIKAEKNSFNDRR